MPLSLSSYTAQRLTSLASPQIQAPDGLESHYLTGSPLHKKCPVLDSHASGSGILPIFAMSQKMAKTSFNHGRNIEVADRMNKQMLQLAQMSRDVYQAKMEYQRLRMQELEMMRVVIGSELEETQGYLSQAESQVDQIRHDLLDGRALLGCNIGQCTHFKQFATFSRDGSPGCGGAYSARRSEYTAEC